MENKKKMKHGKIGLLSLVISLVPIVYLIIRSRMGMFVSKDIKVEVIWSLITVFVLTSPVISLALGIIGLNQSESKRIFAGIGTGISVIMLLWVIFITLIFI
ncbi:hypothetical protein [Clostridium felsineum]|uniref:Uncharacterized protein n=1 Tax=Clostridium felsineum TaxID=36839 RepID=A0A1S8KXM6_9CLOT|nr:hypothetical protein [Clostridium felsineum]MCR3758057.1 hypothetical protein [Clostridium felsineum]URZ03429.1 hypothetical protein CLAUR_034880 [Clostridium felsineum]URZ08254.1 hypothetical protein CLROS_036220 [Clostridium felsineum]URZ13285.1 hypothetical protein CROST_040370 [Clostridium felsineum]